jgi:hypothetical protein
VARAVVTVSASGARAVVPAVLAGPVAVFVAASAGTGVILLDLHLLPDLLHLIVGR